METAPLQNVVSSRQQLARAWGPLGFALALIPVELVILSGSSLDATVYGVPPVLLCQAALACVTVYQGWTHRATLRGWGVAALVLGVGLGILALGALGFVVLLYRNAGAFAGR
jgi:hypothetical protein